MAFDAGLVERVADVLVTAGERGVRQKHVFGGRGFLRGKNAFLIVWNDGLVVKTLKKEYAAALTLDGVRAFAPDGEKPMSTWLVVDAERVAEDPELRDWVGRGLRSLES